MNTAKRQRRAALLSIFFVLSGISSHSVMSAQAPEMKDFRDDFAGTSLRPEWTIVNQDPNRWTLLDNEYLLLVLKDTRNKFCTRMLFLIATSLL